MKKYLNFHLYLRIFLFSIFSFAFVLVFYQQIARAELADGSYPFAGWAWAPTIGWLSLNCLNDWDGDGVLENDDYSIDSSCGGGACDDTCLPIDGGNGSVTYGLSLEVDNTTKERVVTGCAWAGNIGWWICFSNPGDPGDTEAPENGIYLNGPSSDYYYASLPGGLSPLNTEVENSLSHSYNSAYHASILPLEGEAEWTWELGFPIEDSLAGANITSCFNCQASSEKRCSISNATCVDDIECGPGDGTCEDYANNTCENCLEYEYDVNGNLSSTLAGYQCTECDLNSPEARCLDNAYNDNQNTCQTCDAYYTTPGLIVDYASSTNDGYGYMCGWAWNSSGEPNWNGIGWLQFSPRITAGNNPYFQVEAGNIYSRANISNANPLPPNKYNAYIIEAGGTITNFYASSTRPNVQTGAGLPVFQNRSLIDFPVLGSTGYYQNVLGKIDYNGLVAELGETGLNKYGSNLFIDVLPQFWDDVGPDQALGNSVYYNDSDLVGPSAARTIIGGSGVSGAGIVIVNGNLNITHNISYASNEVDKLSEIASLVWIVKGDVTIDPSVTEIAGTFIVLGNGTDCNPVISGCGQFVAEVGVNPLVIYGNVLARSFDLNRTYSALGAPAEKFVNDGRLQVNPPKGMQNFVKSLPKFNYNPY